MRVLSIIVVVIAIIGLLVVGYSKYIHFGAKGEDEETRLLEGSKEEIDELEKKKKELLEERETKLREFRYRQDRNR